jgi:hypothetical protein
MLRGLATPSLPGGFETKSPGQFQATLGPTTNLANIDATPCGRGFSWRKLVDDFSDPAHRSGGGPRRYSLQVREPPELASECTRPCS